MEGVKAEAKSRLQQIREASPGRPAISSSMMSADTLCHAALKVFATLTGDCS